MRSVENASDVGPVEWLINIGQVIEWTDQYRYGPILILINHENFVSVIIGKGLVRRHIILNIHCRQDPRFIRGSEARETIDPWNPSRVLEAGADDAIIHRNIVKIDLRICVSFRSRMRAFSKIDLQFRCRIDRIDPQQLQSMGCTFWHLYRL